MRLSDLQDKKVRTLDGETLGRVHEVHCDKGLITAMMCGPGSLLERLTAQEARSQDSMGMRAPRWTRTRSSSRPTRRGGKLAALEPGNALRDPARGRQSAEVGRVQRRIPFREVDHSNAVIGRDPAHRPKEIADAASRPVGRPERRAFARGRLRRCRSRARSRRQCALHHAPARPPRRMPARRTSSMLTTQLPASSASRCIFAVLAKLARPICAMFLPGRPSSISARTGLPLLRPSSSSRMSKWASSVIRPTSVERHAEREHRRSRDRIVAAGEQGQRMLGRLAATASRIGGGCILDGEAVECHVAAVADRREQRFRPVSTS